MVYGWFAAWRDGGIWKALNHHLLMLDRERVGRSASPSAAVTDSQSVNTTEAAGPCGCDAGKKVKGCKRHAMVDTEGRLLAAQISAACVQDRDGAVPLLQVSRRSFPFIERCFADSAYASDRVEQATRIAMRSCASRRTRSASPSTRAGGSSNACSSGLAATAALRMTSRPRSPPPPLSYTQHPPCCSYDVSLVADEFRVGL